MYLASVQTTASGLVPFSHLVVDGDKEVVDGQFGRVFEATYGNQPLTARHIRRQLLAHGRTSEALGAQAQKLTRLIHCNILQIVGLCIDHTPDIYFLTEVRSGRSTGGRYDCTAANELSQ